ncbi:response regulator [Halomonas sp. V046]|uniref:response regulator n=1 Tax=Halomonas sp. V046 TaxID=3459611 RepID=UPI004043C8CC
MSHQHRACMPNDPANAHILIVEDDPTSRHLLVGYFEKAGYRVSARDSADALEPLIHDTGVDLVLLDISLPGRDGLSVTRELRAQSRIGIILVTGAGDDIDRIVGLEMGADDYVTKPFNPRELLVRVKNLLWRVLAEDAGQSSPDASLWRFEGWSLKARKRELTGPDQHSHRLPEGEFKLLLALLSHPGQVLSRDQLMDAIRQREWTPNDRTIDVLIGRLRRKLQDPSHDPRLILTAHGAGYVFAGELSCS